MKEITYLTGLRFLAAFYVFVFHMYIHGYYKNFPRGVEAIVGQGALGVNVFFVLSGFLLAYSHLKDFSDERFQGVGYFRRFLAKSLARIYPVYFVGMLLFLLVSFGLNFVPAKLPLIVVLNIFMLHSWVPSLAMEWYGGGSWSISTEMFFYLTFPLLMPLLVRIKTANTLFLLLSITIVLAAIPGIWYNYTCTDDLTKFALVYNFPLARAPEFIAGMFTGLLVLRFGWRVPVWGALLALGMTCIYLAFFGFRLGGYVVHNWAVLPTIVLLLGCLAYSPPSFVFNWLGSRIMVYLGRVSYSFYIIQIVLLDTSGILWRRGIIPHVVWWIVPLLFFVNLGAAVIMYELIEKQMHKRFLSWLLPAR